MRVPLALTRSHDTVFIGRRAELARLHACWGGVQMHRDRRIALIAGEPGVGKTRLAQHFASAAIEEGTIVLGETERARKELHATMALTHAFDANWLSLQAELAEASVLIEDSTFAATLYERLAPYAGRPVTAGRAVCSYGAVDHRLGRLAALLGRELDAVHHLEAAIPLNDSSGCIVWRTRAERDLSQLVHDGQARRLNQRRPHPGGPAAPDPEEVVAPPGGPT